MFTGRFWQGHHWHLGTSMYDVDGVVYRINWQHMIGQVWLNWPRTSEPVREGICG